MLDFLKDNADRLFAGEYLRRDGIVYFIWGSILGCRTISCANENDFDNLDTIDLMFATKDVARIDYTGKVILM